MFAANSSCSSLTLLCVKKSRSKLFRFTSEFDRLVEGVELNSEQSSLFELETDVGGELLAILWTASEDVEYKYFGILETVTILWT